MSASLSWLEQIPPHLGIYGSPRAATLEVIRGKHGASHDLFARIVCQCPAARRRTYSYLEQYFIYEKGISDQSERRRLIVFTSISMLDVILKRGDLPTAPIEECLRLVKSILDARKPYNDWQEVVSDCMCVDRALGMMIEGGTIVREVDEQVLGVAADLLTVAPISAAADWLSRIVAAKKKKDDGIA